MPISNRDNGDPAPESLWCKGAKRGWAAEIGKVTQGMVQTQFIS